jgi:hypothetical protein
MSDPPVRQSPPGPNIELPADMEAVYTNLVRISHSPAELVFDFARQLPGQTVALVVSRLLMSPVAAKLFYRALTENLARYEAAYGEIPVPGNSPLANDLFRPHRPPDS